MRDDFVGLDRTSARLHPSFTRMIQIRPEQVAALRQAASLRFEARVIEHLTDVFPAFVEARSGDELRQWIRDASGVAQGYGIRTERDTTLFVDLTVVAGPQPAEHQQMTWSKQILEDAELSGTAKVDWILELMPTRAPGLLHADSSGSHHA